MPVPGVVPVKPQDTSVNSHTKTYVMPVVRSAGAPDSAGRISGHIPALQRA